MMHQQHNPTQPNYLNQQHPVNTSNYGYANNQNQENYY